MDYEFLKRLFTSCSDEAGDHYADGLNLCELYEQVEEVATAQRCWAGALDKAALTHAVRDDMGVAAYALAQAYEQQGFINGFRLSAQMRRELGSGAGLKYDKIMTGGKPENIMTRLTCCCALLDALRWAMNESDTMVDALAGARDLLNSICRDFQADIDGAEGYDGEVTA